MTNFKRTTPALALTLFLLTLTAGAQTLSEAAPGDEKAEASLSSSPQVSEAIFGKGTYGRLARFNGQFAIVNSAISERDEKIGIGTDTPGTKLHLSGANSRVRMQSTDPNDWTATEYVTDSRVWHTGVGGSNVSNDLKGKFYFWDQTAQQLRMVIDAEGKVGIGTYAPQRPLEITNGQLRLTSSHGDVEFSEIADLVSHVTSPSPAGSQPALRVIVGTNLTNVFTVFNDGKAEVAGTLQVNSGSCTGCSPPSDRSLKANISAVNPRLILDKLARVPVQTWNYKSEPESVRHIGPMAQDFRAAFSLGADDRTLNTVDAQGVTMASVQALYQMMLEKERQIEALARKVEQQQAQFDQLRRSLGRRRAAAKRPARAR